jgi:MoaA/NifB/PqqE/SkfB family radical SAM enzyme
MKDNKPRLPTKKIISALKNISTAQELCIVGGEPTLFKDELIEIVYGISDTSIRTTIITNGILANEDFINKISQFNIHIIFSIDTMDRNFWKFVRGCDSYDIVFNNFKYAKANLSSFKISVQSVLSKETEAHILSVADYLRKEDIYHSIQYYINYAFSGSWTEINNKINTSNDKVKCFSSNRNLSIAQDGSIYTCFQQQLIRGCQKPVGDLNMQSIKEILSDKYILYVSDKMKICNLPCKILKCNTNYD